MCVCVQKSLKDSHGLNLSYWVITRCQAPRTLLCFISFYNSSYNNRNQLDITIPIKEMKKNWKNLSKFSNFIKTKTKTKTKTQFVRSGAGLELAALTTMPQCRREVPVLGSVSFELSSPVSWLHGSFFFFPFMFDLKKIIPRGFQNNFLNWKLSKVIFILTQCFSNSKNIKREDKNMLLKESNRALCYKECVTPACGIESDDEPRLLSAQNWRARLTSKGLSSDSLVHTSDSRSITST